MPYVRLRRIGNSLGTTFSQELLREAGLSGDERLEVVARPGELCLRRVDDLVSVLLSREEAIALVAAETPLECEPALEKVRKALRE